MRDKIEGIIARHDELTELLSDPSITKDLKRFREISQEHSNLSDLASAGKNYIQNLEEIAEMKDILDSGDPELKELAQSELPELKNAVDNQEKQLRVMLIPTDPNDSKNTIFEIRGGTGGEEAALFAGDLYRMYMRYAERKNWNTEVISMNESETGGIKEVVVSIIGKGAYGDLKFESGVHRVQRVPATESSGRLHTSAATVAVLPEAEDIDVELNEDDVKVDTYRASGAGGQHVNKTESAIRLTHIPTGLVVTCQDEKSQRKNKDKAMKVLRSRIFEIEQEAANKERADARRSMVSTGDRSAKIRTYNFPQGRVTDHRINLTLYKLEDILDGDLNEVIEKLKIAERDTLLQEA